MTEVTAYLTLREVAEVLNVSVDFVENLCKGPNPELGHNQFGRTKRVPQDALDAYRQRTFVPASTRVASLDAHRLKPRAA